MYTDPTADEESQEGMVKYYDIRQTKTPPLSHSNTARYGLDQTMMPPLGICCLCASCSCSCHHDSTSPHYHNNEDFIRYLFDYELFSMPYNFSRCGYLIAYLKHEGILPNACVVMADTYTLRGPYARPKVSKANQLNQRRKNDGHDDSMNISLTRSPTSGHLQFQRPINLIESMVDVPDVRMLMRNYMLSDESRDWLYLRYALQMPTFLIYIKLDGSKNELPSADFTALFSLYHLRKARSEVSVGRRLAELVAGIREKYFNVPLPNFDDIEQAFRNMQLDRSLQKHREVTPLESAEHKSSLSTQQAHAYHDDNSPSIDTSAFFIPRNTL